MYHSAYTSPPLCRPTFPKPNHAEMYCSPDCTRTRKTCRYKCTSLPCNRVPASLVPPSQHCYLPTSACPSHSATYLPTLANLQLNHSQVKKPIPSHPPLNQTPTHLHHHHHHHYRKMDPRKPTIFERPKAAVYERPKRATAEPPKVPVTYEKPGVGQRPKQIVAYERPKAPVFERPVFKKRK